MKTRKREEKTLNATVKESEERKYIGCNVCTDRVQVVMDNTDRRFNVKNMFMSELVIVAALYASKRVSCRGKIS